MYNYKDKALYANAYQSGKHPKPSTQDEEKHDNDFFLKYHHYMYAKYCSDQYAVGYGGTSTTNKRDIRELRDYARGRQDSSKYQDMIDPSDPSGKSYMNISWDNVQILPKFRDIIKGKMLSFQFAARAEVISEEGRKEKLRMANKMKFFMNPDVKDLLGEAGMEPPELPVNNEKDVDELYAMGAINLGAEIMLKDALDATLALSDYPALESLIIDDIIDVKHAMLKETVDSEDNVIKVDYIDIARGFHESSIYPDCRDINEAGHFSSKTIAQLREEGHFTESELYKIGKSYLNFHDNNTALGAEKNDFNKRAWREEYYSNYGNYPYDNFVVDVMEIAFIAGVAEKWLVGNHHRDNNKIFDKVKLDSKLNEKDKDRGKSFQNITKPRVYVSNWIVGTKMIYGAGLEVGGVREGKDGRRRSKLPYIIVQEDSPSIIARAINHVDDIQLMTLQQRNLISKIPPAPRMVFDKSLIESTVSIGKDKFDFFEMVDIFSKTGIMVIESIGEWGSDQEGSNRPPFQHLPSGVTEDLSIFTTNIIQSIDTLRMVTGINEVADGSSNQQEMLKGVMEGLQAATNNSLKPLFQLYETLYKSMVNHAAKKWRLAVLAGEVDVSYLPLHSSVMKVTKIDKTIFKHDFGIIFNIVPSAEEKQQMLQELFAQKERQEIDVDAYYFVSNLIRDGDIKKAQLFLSRAVKEKADRMQQQAMEQMQAQASANAESAERAEAAKLATIQAEAEAQIQVEKFKAELQAQFAVEDFERQKALLILEKTLAPEKESQVQENSI
jgi:hypothetical protein